MFTLIETIIAFAVIMLMMSLLVKTFTSVFKNHIDYYSKNLKVEVVRFVEGTLNELGQSLDDGQKEILKKMEWKRLGEEYLTKKNMEWLLETLGISDLRLKYSNFEARLKIHADKIRYAFEKRTKNIALVVGVALCLFMNINAFSIWDRLYNDQMTRSKFSSPKYVESVTAEIKPKEASSGATNKEELEKQRKELRDKFYQFRGEVNFGVGRVYSEELNLTGFLYEFFGSLLTGILISIGAPYWHDILRVFSNLRQKK
jgi:hypothetical protein